MRVPSYWNIRGCPVRIVRTEDSAWTVEAFDRQSQAWERHLTYYSTLLEGDPDADELTREDFEHWVAALRAGISEEEAWHSMLAQSSSLVEGVVEALDGGELYVRGKWWKGQGGLAPTIRVGDWIQMRIEAEVPVITEVRPARR